MLAMLHHGLHLLRPVPQHRLQVTDKSVNIALARRLQDDVLVVIISERAGQLLVVHLGLVLPNSPPPGHLVRIGHLELPAVAGPDDEVLARLVRQQLQQELPQLGTRKSNCGKERCIYLDGSRSCEARPSWSL